MKVGKSGRGRGTYYLGYVLS